MPEESLAWSRRSASPRKPANSKPAPAPSASASGSRCVVEARRYVTAYQSHPGSTYPIQRTAAGLGLRLRRLPLHRLLQAPRPGRAPRRARGLGLRAAICPLHRAAKYFPADVDHPPRAGTPAVVRRSAPSPTPTESARARPLRQTSPRSTNHRGGLQHGCRPAIDPPREEHHHAHHHHRHLPLRQARHPGRWPLRLLRRRLERASCLPEGCRPHDRLARLDLLVAELLADDVPQPLSMRFTLASDRRRPLPPGRGAGARRRARRARRPGLRAARPARDAPRTRLRRRLTTARRAGCVPRPTTRSKHQECDIPDIRGGGGPSPGLSGTARRCRRRLHPRACERSPERQARAARILLNSARCLQFPIDCLDGTLRRELQGEVTQ